MTEARGAGSLRVCVRKWRREFENARAGGIHDDEWTHRPSA